MIGGGNLDTRELKNYIYENNYSEQILESIGCHHIKYHSVGAYWTAGNPDGDNKGAIILYNNESPRGVEGNMLGNRSILLS